MRRLICPFVVLVWHKQVFSWRSIFFCYSSWSRRRRAAIFERGTPWISYRFVFLKLNLNLPLICEESFEVTDHIQGILILKYLNSHFDMNRVVHKLFNPQLEGILAIPTTIPDTPPFMIDTAYMAFFHLYSNAHFLRMNGTQQYCLERARGLCKRRLKISGIFLIKFLFLGLNIAKVTLFCCFSFLYVLLDYILNILRMNILMPDSSLFYNGLCLLDLIV